ncbi:MAG: hypothetical protein Q9192_003334 [Flavoplaca navasiana]
MTFPSAHHSPNTVNKNANEFVIGTVKLNSMPPHLLSALLPQNPLSIRIGKGNNIPALPINKKNHTLPVKFTTSGTQYFGLRNKSNTIHIPPSIFTLIHHSPRDIRAELAGSLLLRLSSEAWVGGWKSSAARRMKGVVRPQAMPTRRKPRVQRIMEGEGGVSEGIGSDIV